jgi:hypothetical protein
VLLAFPAERERWFAHRSELLHLHIQTWLEHMKIEVASPPPWGQVTAQAETAEIPHPTHTGEAPGEILRRQARDILDEIPASELPTALVFLQFLRERGAASLLGLQAPEPASEPSSADQDSRGPADEDLDLPEKDAAAE